MDKKRITPKKQVVFTIISFTAILSMIAALAGCGGRYGSYQRNTKIYQDFQANQVPKNYIYYYNGLGYNIYAIIGIEPKYQIPSKFWRKVEPDTEKFRRLTGAIWEDYGYRTYGADLLDPEGKKIGIVYTSIYTVDLKFLKNDQIEVMLGTPYLWGPEDHGGGEARTPD
jgi:hypothetical protein